MTAFIQLTCRIGNLTRLIHTLAICVTIHAYMCGRNYAELLEADALLPLTFSLSIFALSYVFLVNVLNKTRPSITLVDD